ncbi:MULTISPECIES: hypothetical protein [Halococcus]|uniref:DUF2178 domain-containing protein n=1 Tax=Halococcus salifodinae DSM 8989 TaxID=1227456 RepID=M0MZB5_9EURY|nr:MULTISPECIES: hypothetical protein [Halococcus]EMA50946.1 hypothetical protein C450_14787 [Halococcus salifodinae DSM 8989]
MSRSNSSGRDRLSKRRRYRRLSFGCAIAGTLGFVAAANVGYPLVGVGLYWLGFLAFVGVWRGTAVTLFDERDTAHERRASHITLTVIAVTGIAGWPALLVLEETGYYTIPPVLEGALFGYSALFGLFGIAYLWVRYRP